MSPTGLKRSKGGEEQNVVLALVVAFFVIMLLELGERFPQRTFPEQDQMGQALLFNRSHPALCKGGMDRIRPKLGHCEIKLGSSVSCEPTEPASREQHIRAPARALQDLPALAGPAVVL